MSHFRDRFLAAIISVRRTIYAFVGKYHTNTLRQSHYPRFCEKNCLCFFLWFCSFSNEIFTRIPCGAAWLKARKTLIAKRLTVRHRQELCRAEWHSYYGLSPVMSRVEYVWDMLKQRIYRREHIAKKFDRATRSFARRMGQYSTEV